MTFSLLQMRPWNLIKTILIEGNIGVGKTTIMSHIASSYPSNLIQIHREPVENWMNINGFDLLKALTSKKHTNARNNHPIHVYERSILSCFHVFIHHDFEQKYLNEAEFRILQDHYEFALRKSMDLSTTAILYLDLSPEECLDRVIKRSRQSEASIDLKRLKQLKEHYERFIYHFKLCPVEIIDASQSIGKTCQQVDSILAQYIKQNQLNDLTKSPIVTE